MATLSIHINCSYLYQCQSFPYNYSILLNATTNSLNFHDIVVHFNLRLFH